MSDTTMTDEAEESDIESATAACKAALERLGGAALSDTNVDDKGAIALALKPYLQEQGGVRYDEVSYFLEMLAYLRIHTRIKETRARITALRAQPAQPPEEPDLTLSRGERRRRRKALINPIEQLEVTIRTLEVQRNLQRSAVRSALQSWCMLCFSQCCKDAECCHIRQAIEILPLLREAQSNASGDPENAGLIRTLEAHRERLVQCLGDGMRAAAQFANLMHESAGELWRNFVDVLINAFGIVVDMLESERTNPTPKFVN